MVADDFLVLVFASSVPNFDSDFGAFFGFIDAVGHLDGDGGGVGVGEERRSVLDELVDEGGFANFGLAHEADGDHFLVFYHTAQKGILFKFAGKIRSSSYIYTFMTIHISFHISVKENQKD